MEFCQTGCIPPPQQHFQSQQSFFPSITTDQFFFAMSVLTLTSIATRFISAATAPESLLMLDNIATSLYSLATAPESLLALSSVATKYATTPGGCWYK
jgi:hypothetical protein